MENHRSFNSRSRVGSDSVRRGVDFRNLLSFQFTLPRGERQVGRGQDSPRRGEFQFTLPRGERPQPVRFLHIAHRVSIHAPAWGAT